MNKVIIKIYDCQYCPCATLKFDKGSEQDFMYCQTKDSCLCLRKGWGPRRIPDWCPYLYFGSNCNIKHKLYLKEKYK